MRAEAAKFNEPEKLARLTGCRSIFNVGIALPLLEDVETETAESVEMGRIEQRLNISCLLSQLVNVIADNSTSDNVSGVAGLATKLLEPSSGSVKLNRGIAILSDPQKSGKGSHWTACRDALVDEVMNPALLSSRQPKGNVPVTLLLLLYDLRGVLCGAECHGIGNTVDSTNACASVEALVVPPAAAATAAGPEEDKTITAYTTVQQMVQTHNPALVVLSFAEAEEAVVSGENSQSQSQQQRSLFRFADGVSDGTHNIEIAVRAALQATSSGDAHATSTGTSSSSSSSSSGVSSSLSSSISLLVCFTLCSSSGSNSCSSSSSSSSDSSISATVETVARVLLE